jgi:hypothetical protein
MALRRRNIFAPRESLIQAAVEWRSVEGFPAYEVSSDGFVRNVDTGLILKPEAGHLGHLRVTLFSESGRQRHLVHRLVLLHFVGPAPSEEHECAHWDGDPTNNQVGNLRWATRKENTDDTKRHGRFPVGEKSHFAKLTEARAVEIRKRLASGASMRALADEFELDISQINRIACGLAWAHLGDRLRKRKERNKIDETSVAGAIAEVDSGASISQAAKRHRISRQTIRRRLTALGPSEKEIHQATIDHWRYFGAPNTLVATLANAGALGQPGLTAGLFDLVVIGDLIGGAKVGFIELKRDNKAALSPHQIAFKELLASHGILFAVTYGRDAPIRVLEQWGAVRPQAKAAA